MRERCPRLFHVMTSVIKNDVGRTELIDDTLQESCIALIADTYIDTLGSMLRARGVYIKADDDGRWAKILLPHLK